MSAIINKANAKIFEEIRRHDDDIGEYWSARELMGVLGYGTWDKFKGVINKAVIACANSSPGAHALERKRNRAKAITGKTARWGERGKLSTDGNNE